MNEMTNSASPAPTVAALEKADSRPAGSAGAAPQVALRQSAWSRLTRPSSLLTLAVLGVLGWQWYDMRSRVDGLNEALAAERSAAQEARTLARDTQENVAALQAKIGALDAQLDAAQGEQQALQTLYQELSRTREERVMAEIEQSLTIAAQQLQLAGNVEAALIALQGAEARLSRAAQPQLIAVRKLIARDIDRLKALPTSDVSGMALRLESVVSSVDSLPLAFEQRPSIARAPMPATKPAAKGGLKSAARPTEPTWVEKFGADVWAEVRQLVRVQRTDQADPALLAPDQAFYLRENLKLRLINARVALLARDGRSFKEDMRQADDWLGRYFDSSAKTVQAARAMVHGLAGLDIGRDLPSLDDTLNAVRNVKLVREKR